MSANSLFEHAVTCKIIIDRVKELSTLTADVKSSNLYRLHVDGTLWSGPWNTTRSIRETIRKMTAEDIEQNIQNKASDWEFFSESAYQKRQQGIAVNKNEFYVEHTIPCETLKTELVNQCMSTDMSAKDIAVWVLDNHVSCLVSQGEQLGIGNAPNKEYPFKRYPFKVVNAEGQDVSAWSRNDIAVYMKSKYTALRTALKSFNETLVTEVQLTKLESGRPKEILRPAVWYTQSRTQQFNEAYHDFKARYTKDYFNYGS